MSGELEEAERVKKIIAFKQKIEKKIEELKSELKENQEILEVIDKILLEKSFKRVEIAKPAEIQPPLKETIKLTTTTGEPLVNLYVSEDTLRVVPVEDKKFNVNTPPFTQFLVERVLMKMQEKDRNLAKMGQLKSEKIFSYTIMRKGDLIQEIIIKNFNEERLRELKSSIRWTFEKMYEKVKS